jgi:hypothetical protein
MKDYKQAKNVSVTVRIEEEIFNLLNKICKDERRSGISEVARFLLMRGVELYKRDGRLFDPDDDVEQNLNSHKKGA